MQRRILNVSVAHWPFEKVGKERLIKFAVEHGVDLELAPLNWSEDLRTAGVKNALLLFNYEDGTAPFEIGFGSKAEIKRVKAKTKAYIDLAAQYGHERVIAFTGNGEPTSESKERCVTNLRSIIDYAADRGVILCLEHLNSVDSRSMRGHPGYMGDKLDWVADIVHEVGSPNLRLLFDLYHVQLMHPGEVRALLHKYLSIIGHIHVAQVPDRTELYMDGAIDFPGALKYLAQKGYTGHVGIEYIPGENSDQLAGLERSLEVFNLKP